ncbi:DUF3306 domain-containing protein [Comamonadaceae bacterium G21597-S1]|nr:DUF3306 domain-containing protein [Comamonadaceae bacterium G21597-S1]
MVDGFLGRWSQRKTAARESQATAPPERPAPVQTDAAPAPADAIPAARPPSASGERAEAAPRTEAPPPTLQDVAALHADSDFKPFVARAVAPEVRNAAMKKLFSDPHFNVMDGLDTYIDDYSLPDPLPAAMLRKMASAQFLKLFDDESDKPAGDPAAAQGPGPEPASEPQGAPAPLDTEPERAQSQASDIANPDPDGTEPRT